MTTGMDDAKAKVKANAAKAKVEVSEAFLVPGSLDLLAIALKVRVKVNGPGSTLVKRNRRTLTSFGS